MSTDSTTVGRPLEYPRKEILGHIRRLADAYGRAPTAAEFDRDNDSCSPQLVIVKFGSWNDALQVAGYEPSRKPLVVSDLAREMNRLYYELGAIPRWSDVKEKGRYAKPTYQKQFDGHDDCLRKSNIVPPIDHVCRAVRTFYNRGSSYVSTKKLRRFMYPRMNGGDTSRDFGVENNIASQTDEASIKEEWDYPPLSVARVSRELTKIEKGRVDTDVELEVWSGSQKKTWRIEVQDNDG